MILLYMDIVLVVYIDLVLTQCKVKVKLSLCLTEHHAMKVYWGSGGIAALILRPWH
jgi:hypothetical protein